MEHGSGKHMIFHQMRIQSKALLLIRIHATKQRSNNFNRVCASILIVCSVSMYCFYVPFVKNIDIINF